jgi:putative FmdB family regulatory protein
MPTYDYRCAECGHRFEAVQSFHDDPITDCPSCGRTQTVRKVYGNVGVVLKGSGFYRTDNRSGSRTGSSSSGGSDGGSSDSGSKSDPGSKSSDSGSKGSDSKSSDSRGSDSKGSDSKGSGSKGSGSSSEKKAAAG